MYYYNRLIPNNIPTNIDTCLKCCCSFKTSTIKRNKMFLFKLHILINITVLLLHIKLTTH